LDSITDSRIELDALFEQSPSLRHHAQGSFESIYPKAVRQAARQTGLSKREFPEECPFSLEQALDDEFLPE
jgi:hypothetical protein